MPLTYYIAKVMQNWEMHTHFFILTHNVPLYTCLYYFCQHTCSNTQHICIHWNVATVIWLNVDWVMGFIREAFLSLNVLFAQAASPNSETSILRSLHLAPTWISLHWLLEDSLELTVKKYHFMKGHRVFTNNFPTGRNFEVSLYFSCICIVNKLSVFL